MSGQKVTKSSKDVAATSGSVSATMKKAFKKDSTWEDKDEFLDVIYWFRQILAIVLGIIWGILPLKGILAIGLFVLVNAGVLYIYFTNFQKIDEEEYGGPWELTKEGFMTSFSLFLESTLLAEHEWPAFIPDWLSTSNLIETHGFDATLVKE